MTLYVMFLISKLTFFFRTIFRQRLQTIITWTQTTSCLQISQSSEWTRSQLTLLSYLTVLPSPFQALSTMLQHRWGIIPSSRVLTKALAWDSDRVPSSFFWLWEDTGKAGMLEETPNHREMAGMLWMQVWSPELVYTRALKTIMKLGLSREWSILSANLKKTGWSHK